MSYISTYFTLTVNVAKILRLLAKCYTFTGVYVYWRSVIRLLATVSGEFYVYWRSVIRLLAILRLLAKCYTFTGVLRLLALHGVSGRSWRN